VNANELRDWYGTDALCEFQALLHKKSPETTLCPDRLASWWDRRGVMTKRFLTRNIRRANEYFPDRRWGPGDFFSPSLAADAVPCGG